MRTLGQLTCIGLTTLLSSYLVGCGPASGPDGGAGATPGSGGGPAGTGGTGSGTGGADGSGGSDPSVCIPGVPVTSQFPRLTGRQYDNVIEDLLGVTTIASGSFVGQKPSAMLNPDFEGSMNRYAWDAYLLTAETIASDVMADPGLRANFIACDPAAAGCMTETIRNFGRKAFRRPMTDGDIARFEALAVTEIQGTPEEIAETTLFAFLASPSFLTITELESGTPMAEDNAPEGAIKLSSFEVAARLSFLLWGSIPDEELNTAATAGQLTTKAQILAQAQRMVSGENQAKVAPQVVQALRAWAQMDDDNSHWFDTNHPAETYPEFTAQTNEALSGEMDAFFTDVAIAGGSFSDLFLSPFAFVNQHNAAIYDKDPAAYGDDFEKIELDPTQRPGFLTRGGFLAGYAHSTWTSPILRGAYINLKMIGYDPGPPSPNAPNSPKPTGTYTTERAYVEALTSPADCVGCHSNYVNPPGFVLENFDAIGAWQDVDPRGDPIDPKVNLTVGGSTKEITTPLQLMTEIAAAPSARRNFAEKVTAFASGRPPNSNDACTVETLETALASETYTVVNLLTDLTQADSLRLRTVGN